MQATNMKAFLLNMHRQGDDMLRPMLRTVAGGATAVGVVPAWVAQQNLSPNAIFTWTVGQCTQYFQEYGELGLLDNTLVALKRSAVLNHLGVRV